MFLSSTALAVRIHHKDEVLISDILTITSTAMPQIKILNPDFHATIGAEIDLNSVGRLVLTTPAGGGDIILQPSLGDGTKDVIIFDDTTNPVHLLWRTAGKGNIGTSLTVACPDNIFAKTNISAGNNIAAGGQFLVEDGTAANPSIYFTDLDGGIYSGTGINFALGELDIMAITTTAVTLANNINLTLSGTGKVAIGTATDMLAPLNITGDTASIEDRHEGIWIRGKTGAYIVQTNVRGPRLEIGGGASLDTDPAMSVNYLTGHVGIGTTTPDYILDIDAGEIGEGNYDGLRIIDTGWKATSRPMLEFYNSNAQFGGGGTLARIYGEIGSLGTNSKLYFAVADSSKSLQDRMVIDKSGNVGIGTTTPSERLDLGSGNLTTTGDLNIGTGGTVLDVDSALGTVGIGTAAMSGNILNVSSTLTATDDFVFINGTGSLTTGAAAKSFHALKFFLNATINHDTTSIVGVNAEVSVSSVSGDALTVDEVVGVRSDIDITKGGPGGVADLTVTDVYMFKGEAIGATGVNAVIDNLYGLFLPDITEGTANWAIYSAGGDSSHAGNFRFGSNVAPVATVDVTGTVDVTHTAASADDHTLEIVTDAAGFGDVKALEIDYISGDIAMGEDEAIMLINIDELASTGGDIFALEVLSTEGSGEVFGLKVGATVGPIHQDSGTFANPTTGTDNTTSTDVAAMIDGDPCTTTTIFENDDEYILIGADVAFEELEVVLITPSSNNIKPTFWYSTAGSHLFTEFTPVDGTDGFKHTGIVAWDPSDLTSHAVNTDTGTFDIKVIRTRNNLTTDPVLGYIKVASTTEYIWDKDGDVNVKSITMTDDLAVADGGTNKSSWTQYLIPYTDTTTSFSQIAIGTDGQVLTSGGAGVAPAFEDATGGVNGYPQRATMWHDEATVTTGNALTHDRATSQRYQTRSFQDAPAINDAFSHSCFLKAGTYEFSVLGAKTVASGKVDWAIDGNGIVSNQDWRNAGGTLNDIIQTVSSVTVTGDGYHKITGVVDITAGSGYGLTLTKYWFWVASADPARE